MIQVKKRQLPYVYLLDRPDSRLFSGISYYFLILQNGSHNLLIRLQPA